MANLLKCPISPLQSNCSPSLEIAYHQHSLLTATPYHKNSCRPPIYPAPSPAQQTCAISDPCLHRASTRGFSLTLFSPLPHLTLGPLTFPPMNPLFPAMAKSRSTSSSVVPFPHFDFLSIKGAWINSLLFICSSVLSIYH